MGVAMDPPKPVEDLFVVKYIVNTRATRNNQNVCVLNILYRMLGP
jgi:hypothetical protein